MCMLNIIKNSSFEYAGYMVENQGEKTWQINKRSSGIKYTTQVISVISKRQESKIYLNSNPLQYAPMSHRIYSRFYFSEKSGTICTISRYYGKKKKFYINFDDIKTMNYSKEENCL